MKFRVTCYEWVEGYGPVCWSGYEDYDFDTEKEAREFYDERQAVQKSVLYNEDGTPSEQYVCSQSVKIDTLTPPDFMAIEDDFLGLLDL